MTEESHLKHLEFIQSVVTRMAGNSFLLKGWSVTLAAALFALAAKDTNPRFALLALFPATVFWGLDAFYLRQERLFRILYDAVRMKSDYEAFSLCTIPFQNQTPSWFLTLFAGTVVAFHGIVIIAVVIVSWFLSAKGN